MTEVNEFKLVNNAASLFDQIEDDIFDDNELEKAVDYIYQVGNMFGLPRDLNLIETYVRSRMRKLGTEQNLDKVKQKTHSKLSQKLVYDIDVTPDEALDDLDDNYNEQLELSYKKKYQNNDIIDQGKVKANYGHPAYSLTKEDLQNEIHRIKNDKIFERIDKEKKEDKELER